MKKVDPAAAIRGQLGYITEEELRALLAITLGSLRNRQAAGDLPPSYKLGRDKFYKLNEVDQWIRRRRVARSVGRAAAAA